VECVAFDPRSRQDDVICEIRGLGNKGSWTDDDSRLGQATKPASMALAALASANFFRLVRPKEWRCDPPFYSLAWGNAYLSVPKT
jgi:hypothetical protein